MTEAPAARPRCQLRIWWFMVAVVVAAVLLALPESTLMSLGFLSVVAAAIPGALTGLGAWLAPRGRRGAVAFWVAAVTPLALLAWLMVVRLTWITRALQPQDHSLLLSWTLAIPYVDVQLALLVVLPALFLGSIVASGTRRGRGVERVFALPAIWALTWMVLDADPFRLSAWVWD